MDTEEEVVIKRQSRRIDSYLNFNVKINEVIDISGACLDLPEEGPEFLDNV